MNTTSFGSIEEARAALALAGEGGFRFRCGVCGKAHRYPDGGYRRCLRLLKRRLSGTYVLVPGQDEYPEFVREGRSHIAAPWWCPQWLGPAPVVLSPYPEDLLVVLVMGLSAAEAGPVLREELRRRAEHIFAPEMPAARRAQQAYRIAEAWLEQVLADLSVLERAAFDVFRFARGDVRSAKLIRLPECIPPPPPGIDVATVVGRAWAVELARVAGLPGAGWCLWSFSYSGGWLRAELSDGPRGARRVVRARFPGPVEVEG